MEITLNGQKTIIPDPSTLFSLMKNKNISPQATVAELNGIIVSDLNVDLKTGDVLELIRMVGGG